MGKIRTAVATSHNNRLYHRYFFLRIQNIQIQKDIKKLRLARDGEKAVSEFLDLFSNEGYRVLHDLVVGDFNIDHIMIGKNGIYTIETKTISKFTKGVQKIYYDGYLRTREEFKRNQR
jgi:hypothetical protein